MSYKVTIAMPVYNVGEDIRRAINSVFEQTFSSIELLIIDDKGSDNSIDIARQMIAGHARGADARIIDHGVNRGTGATKNSAMDHARGEYIYFMDSDDVIVPDCIEVLYEQMMLRPVDFVAASFRKISSDGQQTIFVKQLKNTTRSEPYALAKYRRGRDSALYVMTWNKLFSLDFLRRNQIRCIAHHLNEDVWFSFQLHYATTSFTLIDRILYDWYLRPNSTTHSVLNEGLKPEKVETFNEILQYKKEAILLNEKASRCPYIVDDVVAFAMALSERILRSTLDSCTQKGLIIKVTDMNDIRQFRPDKITNRLSFMIFRFKAKRWLFLYLKGIRYGRGLLHALSHPIQTIKRRFT